MRINQVVLVPLFGRGKGFGRYHGRYCEREAVVAYFDPLCEYLEQDGVPYTIQDEDDLVQPQSLVVHCGVGWDKLSPSQQKTNYSLIAYGQPKSKKVAEIMIETVSDWGKLYGQLAHRTKEVSNDKKNMLLRYENTVGIYIEPFAVNGLYAEEYFKGAPIFGKMLAQCIFEYMWPRNEIPKLHSVIR